jgi:ubiquinone/menaquinone biosynthesis C-methylase UbiE
VPDFLPAAGRFLPLAAYDTAARLTMRERRWRPDLAARVAAASPRAVVEIGAGTGSLTALLRAALPDEVALTALDADERALAIARRRVTHGVAWVHARAEALPLADASQDVAITALVLHHLAAPAKRSALAEIRRILRPGGLLLIADFGPPQDILMSLAFTIIKLADGPSTAGHADGLIARLVADAGFADVTRLRRVRTAVGSLEVLRAS